MSEPDGGSAAAPSSSAVAPALPVSELALIDQLCATAERPEALWMGLKLARRALDQTLPEAIRSRWGFLASVMQTRLHASDSREPLSSSFGAGVEHLTTEQLSMLRAVTEASRDCEVQAFTDLLWLKTRDPRFARQAVRAYLASAERLENANHWPPFTGRLERAARLTRTLGRDDPTLTEVLDTILAKIRVYRGQDGLFLTNELAKRIARDFDGITVSKFVK